MSDDYLWDGSGTPDPDVQRLEALLGRLRTPSAGAPAPRLPQPPIRWRTPRYLGPALAAAAAVIVMIGVTLRTTRAVASWEVASLAGRPRVGSSALDGAGRIAVGQTLVTDAGSQARLTVGTIGQVTIDTNTRVRLVAAPRTEEFGAVFRVGPISRPDIADRHACLFRARHRCDDQNQTEY